MAIMRKLMLRGAERLTARRPPDMVIGDDYLHRWYVIPRNRWFNVYLHEYHGSDDDRALHDHPWPSLSWLLRGTLGEITDPSGDYPARVIHAGQWRFRRPTFAHRLFLIRREPAPLTLFITGPKVRTWGFHCPQGWRPWRKFVDPDNPGQPGPGCD